MAGQAALIIDYAAALHDAEPISADGEHPVMAASSQDGREAAAALVAAGAHIMFKVRTAVANGTCERDLAVAERWAQRPFRPAA